MWLVAARRTAFLLVLLVTGAVTAACFHYAYNVKQSSGSQSAAWPALGTFAWGADSVGVVLGVWLAGRSRVWGAWSGRMRAATYLLAYTYGRMLFFAVQEWLVQDHSGRSDSQSGPIPFQWPGAGVQDYARPALDLLWLLMLVWIFVPVFTMTRGTLTDERDETRVRGAFSIASIFGWTTAAAMILVWIRFLTWKGVAPETAYSYMTPTQALLEYVVEYLPSMLILVACVFLLVWGWSGKWWLPFVTFAAALLIDSFGHKALYAVLQWTRGSSISGNVLTGSAIEHWSYIAGRTWAAWTAFGAARLAGVRFRRTSRTNGTICLPAQLVRTKQ